MPQAQVLAMRPNPDKHNPDPAYIKSLLERANLSPLKAGRAIGLGERIIYYYLDGQRTCPYPVQFCLECLPRKK